MSNLAVMEPARRAAHKRMEAHAGDRRGPLRPGRLIAARARLRGRIVAALLQSGDAAVLLAAGLVARHSAAPDAVRGLFLAATLAVPLALMLLQGYRFGRREALGVHLARVCAGFTVGLAAAVTAMLPFAPNAGLYAAVAAWAAPGLLAVIGAHVGWWLCVRGWRRSGRLTPNIVVVGATGAAKRLIDGGLARRDVNILGVFDDRLARAPERVEGVPVLGDTRALIDHRIMPYVDRVVITVPPRARKRVGQLIERLRVLPNEVSLLLDGQDPSHEAAAIQRLCDVPLAQISGAPVDDVRAAAKRAQDIMISALALALASPILLGIAVAVRLDSPGPALFRQRRHGFNNEEIVVWKFRSMRVEAADATASKQVRAGDDRVTRIGAFLRRTSLDELPQLINVLKGEMSLVGPRPHAVGMKTGDVESARLVAEYAHRHRMKPGMTGWAAIHGSRGPVDTPERVRWRVQLDVEYIERQSFWLDLYIMAMTLPCLLGDSDAVR